MRDTDNTRSSARKKAAPKKRGLSKAEARFKLLAETAGRLLELEDPQGAVDELCRKALDHLECQVFFNYLADERAGKLRLNAFAGIPPEEARKIEWLDYGVAVCGCVAQDGVCIVAEDIPDSADPRTNLVRSYGVLAYACHPLLAQGRVIGTLSFGTRIRTRFSADDLEVMKTIADQVAIAMERIRDRRILQASEERFRSMADGSPSIVWVIDCSGDIEFVNRACREFFGVTFEQVRGQNWKPLVHPDDIEAYAKAIAQSVGQRKPFCAEARVKRSDGQWRWLSSLGEPRFSSDGAFLGHVGSSRDITDRKEAEERIERQFNQLQAAQADLEYQALLLGQVHDAVIGADADTRITYWNKGAERMYGFSEEEALGKTTRQLLRATYAPGEREKILDDLDRYGAAKATIRTRHKSGADIIVEVNSTRMTDGSGTTTGFVVVYRDVTEREGVGNELIRTRAHLENLIDYANAPIIVWDPSFRITRFNHAFERLTGLPAEDVIGRSLDVLFPEESREASLGHIKRTLAGERWEVVEIPILRTDGTIRTVLWNSANIYGEDGSMISATIAQGQDITDRKEAEEEAKWLASFPMLNPLPVVELDTSGRIYFSNPAAQALFPDLQDLGTDHPWLAGLNWLAESGLEPGAGPRQREVCLGERWFQQSMYYVPETRRLRVYGSEITRLKNVEKELRHQSEELQRLTETLEQSVHERTFELAQANELLRAEISNRRVIEADLNQQRETLQTLIDSIPVMLCFFDPSGRAKLTNREFERLLGWSKEEAGNLEIAPAKKKKKAAVPPTGSFEGIPGWQEYVLKTRGGPDLESSWATVQLSDGGQIRIGLDMRERRAAEEDRLRLAAAVAQAKESMAITDAGGHIIYVNPAFEKTSGLSRADLLGKSYYDLLAGVDGDKGLAKQAQQTMARGDAWNAHLIRMQRGDLTMELDIRISPIRDRSGNIINFLVTERDVTHEVRLQDHLRQAQKMEALGTLAGGIAHDINNILNPIFINTELVLMDAALDQVARRDLETVLKAAERGRDLVKQIITFSRQKEKERKPAKVGPVIKEALKFLRSSLPVTIEIRQRIDPETGFIMADPSQIHQVVMNLCNNAAYAMQERGGVLDVSLTEVEVDRDMSMRHPDLKMGPYLRLIVGDTGTGMAPEVMERAFDPFFTTKKHGEGSGMGLALVHGIVKDYNGAVTVYSEVGKGTTFNIFFPRTLTPEVRPKGEDEGLLKGTECILLVDDEKSQAQSIRNMLNRLGYHVTVKTEAEQALAAFSKEPGRFDLVITDQIMPKLTGVQLAARFLEIRPGLPILLCTGFSEQVDADGARAIGIRGFLMKPFSIREMARAIKAALGYAASG